METQMSLRPHVLATGLMLAALLVCPTAALAQPVDIPAIITMDAPEQTWTSVAIIGQAETDLDGRKGDFSRTGVQATLGHRFELSDKAYFALQGNYIGSYYDFSHSAGNSANNGPYRWEDIHTFSLFGLYGWKAGEKWTWVAGPMFRLSGESGANMSDAVTGGGVVGFNYKASDTLTLGLLLGVVSQIEDSAALLPIPTVNWRFADRWKLDFGVLSTLAHPGIGPDISFRPSDEWEIGFGASFQKRRFRLDDHTNNARRPTSSVAPRTNHDGVGQETSFPIYARARWSPSKTAFLDFYGGIAAGGGVRIEKEHGGKIKSTSYDPAPIFGIRGQLLF
jgi:hypothetical protein